MVALHCGHPSMVAAGSRHQVVVGCWAVVVVPAPNPAAHPLHLARRKTLLSKRVSPLWSWAAAPTQHEVGKFRLAHSAVEWVAAHPVDDLDNATTVAGTECELAIAGHGARWWRSPAPRTSGSRSG